MPGLLAILSLVLLCSCAPRAHMIHFPASSTARVDLSGLERLGVICFITAHDVEPSLTKKSITSKIADTGAYRLSPLPPKKNQLPRRDDLAPQNPSARFFGNPCP